MKDTYETVSILMNGIGFTYGVANFDEIYGIILVAINLIQLVFVIISEIKKLKSGEKTSTDELKDAVGSVVDIGVDLIEKIRDGDDSNNEGTN